MLGTAEKQCLKVSQINKTKLLVWSNRVTETMMLLIKKYFFLKPRNPRLILSTAAGKSTTL